MTNTALEAALRQVVYFQAMEDALVSRLASRLIHRHFLPDEMLIREGEPSVGMWLVGRGRVKIFKLNPDGEEHVLRLIGDGDTFNDIGAFDGGPNPASAAALSETDVYVLPAEVLHDLLRSDPQFAFRVVQIMSRKVRGLVGQIEDLALYSVIVRLARFLIRQADDPALSGPGVTRATIAAHLATTPQTISTALRELETAGAIRFNRHQIEIIDAPTLRSIAML